MTDRSSKQRINKDIVALNDMLDQMGLTDIHRLFRPKEEKYTFLSKAHGTFPNTDLRIGLSLRVTDLPTKQTSTYSR